jgi:hypothetical protein
VATRLRPLTQWVLNPRLAGRGIATALLLGTLASGPAHAQPGPPPQPSANVSVFATGLQNPRGLKFGSDGSLYVAEGGLGGTNSALGQCEQVPPPVGPYRGSSTSGRISKISPTGQRTTLTDTLPSSQTSPNLGNLASGVADVEFVGGTLYAVLAGAGCSHGVPDVPNSLVQVNQDGTWKVVADLGAFLKANPVQNPQPADFEPDGTWYSLTRLGNDLYAVEPNHGEIDRITTSGQISRIVDLSATEGHVVPTAAVEHGGDLYVSNLGTFPVHRGGQNVYRITPAGQVRIFATGLTAAAGLAFDSQGQLYALETTTEEGAEPTPGTGRVVRITPDGAVEEVASGLTTPTAMVFGSDGQLYVSHIGYAPPPPMGPPPGAGQVVRITVAAAAAAGPPRPHRPRCRRRRLSLARPRPFRFRVRRPAEGTDPAHSSAPGTRLGIQRELWGWTVRLAREVARGF